MSPFSRAGTAPPFGDVLWANNSMIALVRAWRQLSATPADANRGCGRLHPDSLRGHN